MPYRGIEKAAIFLISIGEEAASEIMKNLDMNQVGMITACMNRLNTVKKKDMDEIISEVIGKIHSGDVHVAGEDYVKKILKKGLGDENAVKIMEQAAKENSLDSLKWVDPKTLANFLAGEHPQTDGLDPLHVGGRSGRRSISPSSGGN